MEDGTPLLEKVARAICQVRERNGGPPFDGYDAIYGKQSARKLKEQLFEEASAAIDEVRSFDASQ